jgi:hypothetical protein
VIFADIKTKGAIKSKVKKVRIAWGEQSEPQRLSTIARLLAF